MAEREYILSQSHLLDNLDSQQSAQAVLDRVGGQVAQQQPRWPLVRRGGEELEEARETSDEKEHDDAAEEVDRKRSVREVQEVRSFEAHSLTTR